MRKIFFLLILSILPAGCREKGTDADAYGNFEADEVIISAETNGRILLFDAAEGSEIKKGEILALIDTTLFHLQAEELDAGMKGIRTRIASIDAQNDILKQQIENLNVNIRRTQNLLRDDAATAKQLDDLTGQVAVIEKQVAANNTQKASIQAELQVYGSKKATLEEQISRCTVRSPLDGTLLQKYSEEGEITAAGKPLAKIADLTMMKLKVYASGAQIGNIKTGQECTVRTDNGEKGYYTFTGTVGYISGKAEFTPKIIQTKEERVTLVYAVTIDVKNDGTLKSGMPGEAIF
ncbi:MAG TPA: HlyD family efflux transporter periplasmic adaptor subunit [Bacteroidales bacterium]|nr:HlyD family efflux transporter periplasmic adaptor subunit [Bacteroidales bacterium]